MNIQRKTRMRQAMAHLEKGFTREETISYLIEKKCSSQVAQDIVDDLNPSSSHYQLCKRFFVGGIMLSAVLINMIIFSTTGKVHWGALLLGIFVPFILSMRLWGWTESVVPSKKETLPIGKSLSSNLGGLFSSY